MSNRHDNQSHNSQNGIEFLKDTASILGGVTLILVPMVWYLGRNYSSGYFSAMNIPAFQLNFTIWEYGSVSWPILAIGLLVAIGTYGIVFTRYNSEKSKKTEEGIHPALQIILFLSVSVLLAAVLFNSPRVQLRGITSFVAFGILLNIFAVLLPIPRRRDTMSKVILFLLIICLTIFLVMALGKAAYDEGRVFGITYIATNRIGVNATLKQPILNNIGHRVILSNDSHMAYYEHLRFLTYNNGNYYVFSTISNICRPNQVYLIPQEQILGLEYIDLPPISSICASITP